MNRGGSSGLARPAWRSARAGSKGKIMRTGIRRSRWLTGVAGAALMFGALPAWAVHDDGIFQVDGDAKAATCGAAFGGGASCTGDDWDNDYTCTAGGTPGCTKATPGTGNAADAIGDLVVDPSPASIFTGGGSKDEKDITA